MTTDEIISGLHDDVLRLTAEVKRLQNAFVPLANIGLADKRSAEVLLAIVRQHARLYVPMEAQA
jgi:hypothetical protein